jgi:acetyl-CoA C-acetyltransferase
MISLKFLFTITKFPPKSVYIVAAKRTPIGTFLGKLSNLRAIDLASIAIKGTLDSIQLPPKSIDEVILGNALSAGLGQGPARQAALLSGLSIATPCTSINTLCSSGLKSITLAAQSIALGNAHCAISGGF